MRGCLPVRTASGTPRVARTGTWIYAVERRPPGDLDTQIDAVFGALTDDLSVWRALAERYRPDLFVDLILEEVSGGITISAASLALLADRGVSLGIDVYALGAPGDRACHRDPPSAR
jgi:hypothetical protein